MRKYLYRKLREYLDLYVRPGDRIAVINAKETAEPLEFRGRELLVLESSSREMVSLGSILKRWRNSAPTTCC